MTGATGPHLTGTNHVSLTVTDLETSVAWYERVFAMHPMPVTFPQFEREDIGYAVVLLELNSGVTIGLHTNRANQHDRFDEGRTGLDHVAFGVASRDELRAWITRLDELAIEHTGIRDVREPVAFSTMVFRDPDNIQLELVALHSSRGADGCAMRICTSLQFTAGFNTLS